MQKLIIICSFILKVIVLTSQDIVLPPELKWWIDEIQKANPAVTINDFRLDSNDTISYNEKIEKYTGLLYPIFKRWNYSGNQFAYYDLDMWLQKKGSRYTVSSDIDSGLGVFDRNNNVIFTDSFGSISGLNAISWRRDNQLIAVGLIIRAINSEKYVIDLIIREYTIKKKNVERKEYVYKDAFDSKVRIALQLNWWEQRMDYFSE